jgi:hypothetical protein
MRAEGVIAFGQQLYDDVVALVERLSTLPADQPCYIENVGSSGDEAAVIRTDGEEIGRLRLASEDFHELQRYAKCGEPVGIVLSRPALNLLGILSAPRFRSVISR